MTNQTKSYGIISGAGPMAGISLMTQILQRCQKRGAWRDRDFPTIRLLNIPFSDMLEAGFDPAPVTSELNQAITELEHNSDLIVIACNTLHLFLPQRPISGLINLVDLMKAKIPTGCVPIVIASKTSAENNLHGKLLNITCEYWQPDESQRLIDAILAGQSVNLDFVFELSKTQIVILGCTEYSSIVQNIELPETIIDPLKLAAEFLGNTSISKQQFHQ